MIDARLLAGKKSVWLERNATGKNGDSFRIRT